MRANTHFVDVGETLYSISKVYGVEVSELKEWNGLKSNELSVGQKLVIDTAIPSNIAIETPADTPEVESIEGGEITHTVGEKETLYAISRKYGVTVDDIKNWNTLQSNSLSIGQQLVIKGLNSNAADLPSEKPNTPEVVTASIDPEKSDVPSEPVIDASKVIEFNSRRVKEGALEKVLEEGMAMVIENSTDTRKYLALHRTADVGTVMRVKNLVNNLIIYVRVVGKLPDTGDNSKVMLKISRTAYERLGGLNRQFPVEVSYVP